MMVIVRIRHLYFRGWARFGVQEVALNDPVYQGGA
jgi:hypothetical protein